jgi:GDPmannose 4,6-dehydratase
LLQGDAAKARRALGWQPRIAFADLIAMMVAHDLDLARRERALRKAGYGGPARGAATS